MKPKWITTPKHIQYSVEYPVVSAEGGPLLSYYSKHTGVTLVKAAKDQEGKLKLLPWNSMEGEAVSYDSASAGKDWWLSGSEPHCADCHLTPLWRVKGANISR